MDILECHISTDLFWLRIFGKGFSFTRMPMRFSERNGLKKYLPLPFGWRLGYLTAMTSRRKPPYSLLKDGGLVRMKGQKKYHLNVQYFINGVRVDTFNCYEWGRNINEAIIDLSAKCTFDGYDQVKIERK